MYKLQTNLCKNIFSLFNNRTFLDSSRIFSDSTRPHLISEIGVGTCVNRWRIKKWINLPLRLDRTSPSIPNSNSFVNINLGGWRGPVTLSKSFLEGRID